MRHLITIIIVTTLLVGCNSLSKQEIIQTGVAGTQIALAVLNAAATITPYPTLNISPAEPLPPNNTPTIIVPSQTLPPPQADIVYAKIGQPAACGNSLIARVPAAPAFEKDLFEHHAEGTFLMIKLGLINTTSHSIQIWDGDYSIESDLNGILKTVKPHRAATTYLFIRHGGKLIQDQVDPGVMNWETNLAFDVDPMAKNWILVFKPGFEGGQALCELHFDLTSSG